MNTSSDEQEAARASVRRLARRRRRQAVLRKQTDTEFYEAVKQAKALGVGATVLARDAEVKRDSIYKIVDGSIS
ncbi:hypothetical protein [Mycobacteroides abscessus]|uniref:hypothetical protein n=1 Tax=Mycobacteroides abscessus TaxID=36809 RepID=UPI000925A0A1|nr:hypothetical protein [Mycobacteroides abscessus]SHZ29840.1 Uncharacterised protein [Mycobacteroides abscessus subsp. abscessus]SHZ89348.1 Uncharacterised protein [Mycobacteroides abscessus subsp. abscessus]SHZ89830.1 Uncharacterised protein [Mycobacteroides abscessus subsp. abscessus]SIA65318.1 Uncharacterised protein [Mycobacteroides abscessus subsp. abscessus]SIC38906.1 Uncharacterised protein [Mycobacteroides abscessus subsp. abscessus]